LSTHLLEWSRRHATAHREGNAVADLKDGIPPEAVARERGIPTAALRGIESFYDELGAPAVQVCDGTACRFARGHDALLAIEGAGRVRCLGHCHDAPVVRVGDRVVGRATTALGAPESIDVRLTPETAPIRRTSLATPAIVLRHLLQGPALDVHEDWDLPEDGAAILSAIESSGLRGRGGAAFPTGAKWRIARETPAVDRYVVCNGDEGDPGSFVDRLLLEEDPHAVLAGMRACARAIGATKGILYVRGEYPRARAVVLEAVHAARAARLLGDGFDVEVVTGAGSYVCGEETALLRSIEGLRGEPAPKPPYPAVRGLRGLPTVVQNVETLSVVPWVVRTGARPDTKAICVSGAVVRPGLIEAPFGTPLRDVLMGPCGGAPPGRRWRMALVGGPMGRVLREDAFDTRLGYDELPGLGHGGVVVFDDTVPPLALARHIASFARAESCGNCTPCRTGTAVLDGLLASGAPGRAVLDRLLRTLEMGSLCGFGQGVPRPLRDLVVAFPEVVS
jgi:NADH:ubiquinone oxidoreductase subunit F (NADH-binding)